MTHAQRSKWKKTAHAGLRYYEHLTRKHGKRPDRYYSFRFRVDDRLYEYGVGWLSDGIPEEARKRNPRMGFEEYALEQMRHFRGNVRDGMGPKSPREKRRMLEEAEAQAKQIAASTELEKTSLKRFFEDTYLPVSTTSKSRSSSQHEEGHFKKWIDPVCGGKPIREVSGFDVERIKKRLQDAGRSPRTVEYVMATFRQTWNAAKRAGLVVGDSPSKVVKQPKYDNRRQRFLSPAEAETLLAALKERDTTLYEIALVSLHTGLRAGEIFGLTWGCVDQERGILTLLDTKSGKNRAAFMTGPVKELFAGKVAGKPDHLVFTWGEKKPYREIPPLFRETVRTLKFNDDVTDRRLKITFHSLRHSFASWHAQAGTDLYVIKELLGHCTIQLTERYSHLSDKTLQKAVRNLERMTAMKTAEDEVDAKQDAQRN